MRGYETHVRNMGKHCRKRFH